MEFANDRRALQRGVLRNRWGNFFRVEFKINLHDYIALDQSLDNSVH